MKRYLILYMIFFCSYNLITADELWTSWTKSSFEVNPEITSMVIDSKDRIWISHYSGNRNSVYKNGEWNLVPVPLGKLLAVDENDVVWGNWMILNSYTDAEQKLFYVNYGRQPGQVNSLVFTSPNEAWLGTSFIAPESNGGLYQLFLDKIVDNYITANQFYIIPSSWDRVGYLEIGICNITIDSNGLLWLGTEHNLWTYDRISLVSRDDINKAVNTRLDNDYLYYTNSYVFWTIDLLIDKSDRVWFIAQPLWALPDVEKYKRMVFACYDQYNANIQFFDYTNSPLPEFNINDLLMDRRDTLWVGTETGLFCYNGVGWTQFTTENSGLCDNRVRCLSVTSDNTLWIGTYNGVSRYTGEVLITSVDENATKPETLPVIRSFPNPFNPSTTIEFSLPEAGAASLDIYNIAGQKVRGLVTEILTAGRHTAVWDGKDNSGATVSAGIFFARLTCGERTTTGKMVMVK